MRILAAVIFCIFSVFPSVAQEDGATKRVLSDVLTKYIQPRYADLHMRSQVLQGATAQLCDMPSDANLKSAHVSYLEFANSWAQIEWFRVGPIMSKNRVERILFYPDRKSTGLKQVQRALANEDSSVASFDSLTQKSVAVQGLGALEFILFGTGSETLKANDGAFRCRFGYAVAQNLTDISNTLLTGWKNDGIAAEFWLDPNDENPLYRNDNEALNILIGTMVHGLEALRDVRIGAFLKDEAKLDRPKSALMWRSENTLAMIKSGLSGLGELFTKSGIEQLLPQDNSALGDSVRFEFSQALNTASSLDKPVLELLQSHDDRQKLAYLKLAIGFVISRIDNDFSQRLGLSAGFSFGDGD
ncbi:MAG: imelysin family protein [Lentilitoribacter sp.]